jgi:NADPH:quinone reductase-like Zn-dependent oxidoreductase
MKAIFFKQHGTLDVLEYGDIPEPELETGEALIKVNAVALNHLDIWVTLGWKGLVLPFPHCSGSDVVGEFVFAKGACQFSRGDKVIINPGIVTGKDKWTVCGQESISPYYRILGEHRKGGLAEYMSVPVKNVYRLQNSWSSEEIAASILVGTTAWRMLKIRACALKNETLLIVGAGGGMNVMTLLLAKSLGLTAIVLAGDSRKEKKVFKLGADYVINYRTTPDWHKEVLKITKGEGADIVFDAVGEKTFHQSILSAARGGRIITVGSTSGYKLMIDNRYVFSKQLSILGSTMGSTQDFIDSQEFTAKHINLKLLLDSVEPFSEGIKMLKRLQSGEHFGKIVLTL